VNPAKPHISPHWVDEIYVLQAARAVGLELSPTHMPGVVAYFQVIAEFAAAVNEVELGDHAESAMSYMPCWPRMPE
jgi:hypothetical protein